MDDYVIKRKKGSEIDQKLQRRSARFEKSEQQRPRNACIQIDSIPTHISADNLSPLTRQSDLAISQVAEAVETTITDLIGHLDGAGKITPAHTSQRIIISCCRVHVNRNE